MPCKKLPEVEKCCWCVTDLKSAAAIIAVIGIVTSPALSWAAVRHSYVIRVSCYITTSEHRADAIDINLNNLISFGFGANAGLGPSCLGPLKNTTSTVILRIATTDPQSSSFVKTVKYVGWLVLVADIFFLISNVYFLYRIFHEPAQLASKIFLWMCIVSILLSFVYGMLFIVACISVGGAFPIFELIFTLFDLGLWIMWIYLGYVIYCIYHVNKKATQQSGNTIWDRILQYPQQLYDYFYQRLPTLPSIGNQPQRILPVSQAHNRNIS